MNIKSLLLGSAAALAAVSGAQAADAIVAAEPEPMEYVRVCDAFGTGYFYIPGTETCLKVGGYVRFQVNIRPDVSGVSSWDARTQAYLTFDAKSDTEYGTLTGYIALEADPDRAGNAGDAAAFIDEAFLQIGGFKAGYYYNYWDKGISGETDALASNTLFNSISYLYEGGAFSAGISVDELEGLAGGIDNQVGISGIVTASVGGVSFDLIGGYDAELEEGAIRGLLSADIGAGRLQVAAAYATGLNAYYGISEWTVAASFAFKATDKLTITPAAQYFSDVGFVNNVDAYRVGLTVGYAITDGLAGLATIDYRKTDRKSVV